MWMFTDTSKLSTQTHHQRMFEMLTSKERPVEPGVVQAVLGLPKATSESNPDGTMVVHDPGRP